MNSQSVDIFDDYAKVDQWIKENNVPALAIGIIRESKLKEIRIYGELKQNDPAPYNTIFNVASLTKPIVSILTLKLVSSGDLSLDEPLYNYWIDPDIVNDTSYKKLTARLILSHQTGFKNWRYLNDSAKLKFDFEPGTKFGYSGEGFEYLKKALENKFKKSLVELADSILFSPLGMKDTRFAWDQFTDESRFAQWHDADGNIINQNYKITSISAADNLLTTIEDYGRFAVYVMQGAELDSSIFDQMINPHVPTKDGRFMGLGWEMFLNLGPKKEYALTHSGGDPGVQTLVVLLPVSKQGLIVFTNGDTGYQLYEKLVIELFDIGKEIMEQVK